VRKKEEGTGGVEKKGKTSEYVLKGSREPVELKKRESVFKKGERTGRTKKERGEKSKFFLNAEGNPRTKEKRGRNGKCDGGKREEGSESD